MCRETLQLVEKVLGKEQFPILVTTNNLATQLAKQAKWEEAEELYRDSFRMCNRVVGRQHPLTFETINNLHSLLVLQERYEEAEK
ncbi:hypothetical protein LTR47_012122, partial [Exophiala xenobiotica]